MSDNEFIIEDYNNVKAFASFLPAIAGLWGKPLWAYYVNRGQAISNFGIQDKDGAMLEFIAANKAWRQTALQGFRTFYKENGDCYEPFRNRPDLKAKKIRQTMYVKPYSVRLLETNETLGIETEVEFFTLPNENVPALLRRLTVKNISARAMNIDCIDGLPMLIPWGTRNWMLKNMSRLGEGWFAGVNYTENSVPYYKLPVEALDRPEIVPIKAAHFYCGNLENGGKKTAPRYCIDPDSVFGCQLDFDFPAAFMRQGAFVIDPSICGKNKTPCAMGYFSLSLEPGEKADYFSAIGHNSDYKEIDASAAMILSKGFFEKKEKENKALINEIASCAFTQSAYKNFDSYCEMNFIDNALRGGFPFTIGEGSTYYAYSRVHGDMEREYNNFVVLAEYFSQGNGNYRDINQNRRSDIFFNRAIGDDNIQFYMNLIQIDGFNPLKVFGIRYVFENETERKLFIDDVMRNVNGTDAGFADQLAALARDSLTIGSLFNLIENCKMTMQDRHYILHSLLKHSKKVSLAEHGEGYWSDHWHYNTDLIENFLAIFPDRFKEMMFDRSDYIFYDDGYFVEPRCAKYALFQGKPRQVRALSPDMEKAALIASRKENPHALRTKFGSGDIYYTNLLGKLLCLIANKYASLDPEALGIEMDAGKPNWCDALNGLPGLFGSSSAESLELLRLVSFLNNALSDGYGIAGDAPVSLAAEAAALLEELAEITAAGESNFIFWDKTHSAKEKFRELTRLGISGDEKKYTVSEICAMLSVFEQKLLSCRTKLEGIAVNGIIPTYFEFIPDNYRVSEDEVNALPPAAKARLAASSPVDVQAGATAAMRAIAEEKTQAIIVSSFKRKDLPLFLEGPVHYLRLCSDSQGAAVQQLASEFHRNMLASPLYDAKLDMIKINAPIASAEGIGRITVFTTGWLENESIWLHMEYKYLLELLRCGLGKEFFNMAKTALIPFIDPAVYGRSIFENSSFLVSSAHPDASQHGQGFVARLSGATAEFISMWLAMTSGLKPFSVNNSGLCLSLRPMLSASFFTGEGVFAFNFLGNCRVTYLNSSGKDTFGPNAAEVQSYRITFNDGNTEEINGKTICGKTAQAVRNGKARSIEVTLG